MENAVLDACVLIRNGVRDFLLWVAEAGVFSPVWSDNVHDEWMRNRKAKFNDSDEAIAHARAQMETAFPGANFEPDPQILLTLRLPDPDDVHVVAAAVAAEANTIVTYNAADFPDETLARFGLHKETPDAFCSRIFPETQSDFIQGVRLHRASLKKPRYESEAYLEHVESKLELRKTAVLLKPFQAEI
jgi:hypothetical protein